MLTLKNKKMQLFSWHVSGSDSDPREQWQDTLCGCSAVQGQAELPCPWLSPIHITVTLQFNHSLGIPWSSARKAPGWKELPQVLSVLTAWESCGHPKSLGNTLLLSRTICWSPDQDYLLSRTICCYPELFCYPRTLHDGSWTLLVFEEHVWMYPRVPQQG